jgi:Asp/Glu/hydantoin racemase
MNDQTRQKRILVINPNTSDVVTRAIDAAVDPLRIDGGTDIVVDFLREGPPSLITQQDADGVILPLSRRISNDPSDAFVIACFRDPGLQSAREAAGTRPVFGIAACGILAALAMGERFGIVALMPGSVKRQQNYVRQLGVGERYAGSVPLHLKPDGAANVLAREHLVAVGRKLVEEHGADVLVLGCAGMGGHRRALEDIFGRPIIDPTQQAVAMAIGQLLIAKT